MALIEIADLSYSYPGGRPAVHNVNWRVESGEFVLLAGPSGSGKSTLLRVLNGLVPHFTGGDISGRVIINGADAIAAGPRLLSRHVGLVAQSPEAQMVVDQVEAEIAFALENAAIPESEMRLRVEEVLELLDLTPLRARTITTLSGGERQRVAIAAALALRPQILLLDEPTSQLDPQSAEDVLNALVRLNHDLGLTIILAEHRLERVLRHVDRLTYLEEGTIAADGPVRETLASLPVVPPLIQLAKEFGWRPIPLTVKEARRFALPGAPQNLGEDQAKAAPQTPSAPEEIVLAVDRLTFSYNGHPALREISLQVRQGEVVALVGRNGSGKTTLLRCIVGLLKRRNGEIRVAGRSTQGRDVADICREVAYLPQDPDDLLFAETVKEEMDITLHNHGLKPAPGEIERLLAALGLAEVAEAYPRDLSVGQRQRVAMGAVTVTRPPLILLDEPTRGLDAGAKAALAGIWRRRRDEGASVLLVTHDVELAASVADRVIVLSQGEIIAEGSAVEVLGASPHFAPEIARLFPGSGWLTVGDARRGLAAVGDK